MTSRAKRKLAARIDAKFPVNLVDPNLERTSTERYRLFKPTRPPSWNSVPGLGARFILTAIMAKATALAPDDVEVSEMKSQDTSIPCPCCPARLHRITARTDDRYGQILLCLECGSVLAEDDGPNELENAFKRLAAAST